LSWGTKGIETNLDTAGSDDGYNKGEYKDVLARQKAAEARATKEADIAGTTCEHKLLLTSNVCTLSYSRYGPPPFRLIPLEFAAGLDMLECCLGHYLDIL
jgi:hypothetical protein